MSDDIDLDAILAQAQAFDKKRASTKPVIVDKPTKKVKVSEEVCLCYTGRIYVSVVTNPPNYLLRLWLAVCCVHEPLGRPCAPPPCLPR